MMMVKYHVYIGFPFYVDHYKGKYTILISKIMFLLPAEKEMVAAVVVVRTEQEFVVVVVLLLEDVSTENNKR